MSLADYFSRNATAVAQIGLGLDQTTLRETLDETIVGVGFGLEAKSTEGRALLDLTIRILARLYPTLTLRPGLGADDLAGELADLARSINPLITLCEGDAQIGIAVGQDAPAVAPLVIHTGSFGWDALVSSRCPQTIGDSGNPFGPGAAACLACARVFRAVFFASEDQGLDDDVTFSALDLKPGASRDNLSLHPQQIPDGVALVGLGAIGNAAAWALARTPLAGSIQLIDHQEIELSNLQRYVLARRVDEGRVKVELAAEAFTGELLALPCQMTWADFVVEHGYAWQRVLVALDSARDRRAVQASLPRWIANAWTQPGDLGLSIHSFDGPGACLSCLYLPQQAAESEDAIIAQALGVPERIMQIRQLLFYGEGTPDDLLEAIAVSLQVAPEKVRAFAGRPLRDLYVEGICGGAVLSLGGLGVPRQDVHVPLAHQSALAGLLLAGALAANVYTTPDCQTLITRIDLLRPLARFLTQPALKDGRGICICQDQDYLRAYRVKYAVG